MNLWLISISLKPTVKVKLISMKKLIKFIFRLLAPALKLWFINRTQYAQRPTSYSTIPRCLFWNSIEEAVDAKFYDSIILKVQEIC